MDNQMFQLFTNAKKPIEKYLRDFLSKKQTELGEINRWGKDLMTRFSDFTSQGKMIRGSLVVLSYEMFKEESPPWVTQTAAAMELIHSSLLIHDDIMDKDTFRRGVKTLFHQYREMGEKENLANATHFGASLGICAGDIGFFLAFEILANLNTEENIKQNIVSLWSKELVTVGLAQMQDMYFSSTDTHVDEKKIIDMYRYKTARYTFSIPLMTGAIAAGQDHTTVSQLEKLGEYLGVIFQIKDDELGLFGTESETGKPVGSDIKEKKKTLYALYLSELTDNKLRKKVSKIYGHKEVSVSDLQCLRDIAERTGIIQRIEGKVSALKEKAQPLITALKVPELSKNMLRRILAYNLERTK